MITSSKFFDKSWFGDDQSSNRRHAEADMGPWSVNPEPQRYATLQASLRKNNNRSSVYPTDRYPIRRTIQRKRIGQSIEIEFIGNHNDDYGDESSLKKKKKQDAYLPKIQIKRPKKNRQFLTSRMNHSPLAAELNFITKSSKIKGSKHHNSHQKYRVKLNAESSRLQKFLNHHSSRYDIYEKCVVELRKKPY